MDDDLPGAFGALSRRIVELIQSDEALREGLRGLARAVLAATEPASTKSEPPTGAEAQPPPGPEPENEAGGTPPKPEEPSTNGAPPVAAPLPELTLGQARPGLAEPPKPSLALVPRVVADEDLPGIEAACRLKAEGLRWAAERKKKLDAAADMRTEIAPTDRQILDRAGAQGVHLWMNSPDFVVPAATVVAEAEGCYLALAEALALVRSMLPMLEADRPAFQGGLEVLARAQSALRVAIDRADPARKDPDQFRAYEWLREITRRERFYIDRHMRIDDPADPAGLPSIRAEIARVGERFREAAGREKKRKGLLGQLRFHARKLVPGTGTDHDWRKLMGAVDDLVADGLAPSSIEIRDQLLPIHESMPDDLTDWPRGFRLAMNEVDRYIALRPPTEEEAGAAAGAESSWSPQVAQAAALLAGRAVVLIGGSRRPAAHAALEKALGLARLDWIETREHESIDRFEAHVARPDVALVVLAIRWSSHSFGDVKVFCDRHGKPLVRLKAGYNPNQVATQILDQVSGYLGVGV